MLLAAVAAVALPAAGLAAGRWQLMPILSGSMEPGIDAGSLVLASPVPMTSVRKGDVIVYRIPIGDRHLEAHRVVAIVRRGPHPVVRTKGDANTEPDPWLARLEGATVWKVRFSIPFLGYAAVPVRDPWIALLAGTLAVAGLCAIVLRRLWRRPVPPGAGHVPVHR